MLHKLFDPRRGERRGFSGRHNRLPEKFKTEFLQRLFFYGHISLDGELKVLGTPPSRV